MRRCVTSQTGPDEAAAPRGVDANVSSLPERDASSLSGSGGGIGLLRHAHADLPNQIREALRLSASPACPLEVVPTVSESHSKPAISFPANGSPLELQILSWNVCGLQLDDDSLFAFTCQLQNDLTSWDVVLLQEVTACSHEQRLILKGGHILFIASSSTGARANGILLHSRWSACVEEFQTDSDETCWLDLDFKTRVCDKYDLVRVHSVHLPHYGYDDDAYQLALDALTHSLAGRGQGPLRLHLIGMDANAVVGPVE